MKLACRWYNFYLTATQSYADIGTSNVRKTFGTHAISIALRK